MRLVLSMPPLRSSRVSKACTLCRKQKTRCYPSNSDDETCLRCETLAQTCSLARIDPVPSLNHRSTTTIIDSASASREHCDLDAINERYTSPNFQYSTWPYADKSDSSGLRMSSQVWSKDWIQMLQEMRDLGLPSSLCQRSPMR